jgi:hypothetical protein
MARGQLVRSTRAMDHPEAAAKASLPNGSRPGTMKITSSAMRLSKVGKSPAWLAVIQAVPNSRIACSSDVMFQQPSMATKDRRALPARA